MIEPIREVYGKTDDPGLSDKQQRVLAALLTNATIRQASEASLVSEATIYRYKNDPTFAAALKSAQNARMNAAVGYLQSGLADALAALHDIMTDPTKQTTARVAAAAKFASFSLQTYYDHSETAELIERLRQTLEDLERVD
jgi:hypothetical protein